MRFRLDAGLADCVEMKNGSEVELTLIGLLDGDNTSSTVEITVNRNGDEENVDLDTSMQSNCSDVYPG